MRWFPLLEPQEEYTLAKSWCGTATATRLTHLRLVVKIAKGFRGRGLPISDLISEGNVGLMRALDRFEPEKGFRGSRHTPSGGLRRRSRNISCAPGRW
jgi:RNA polymerase sigma-32 factor